MYNFRCTLTMLLFFLYYATLVKCKETNITIPLNKIITQGNRELFGEFLYVNSSSTLRVNFENVAKYIHFVIFQVHSHIYNVTVCKNICENNSTFYGTNIGFYSSNPNIDTFYIQNKNFDVKLYISVHGYTSKEPIPGGCIIEASVDACPFVQAKYNKDYVFVDVHPPQMYNDEECLKTSSVSIMFYIMYLPEKNYDSDTYFEGIRNMMTWEKIMQNGNFVDISHENINWRVRRILSAYPGTGAVYVAVARVIGDTSSYSVYVPTHTYACSPLEEDGCELLYDSLSQLMCALLFFIGLFLCYVGHRFFKTQTFIVGVFAGVTITYITMCLIADLERPALLSVSALSGLCFGGLGLMCWWLFGIPLVTIFMSTMNVGFLCSCVMYFATPSYDNYLYNDSIFWFLFITLMFIISILLLILNHISNMFCCAVIGSYATVYSLDYYIGSNLKYIIINVLRRAYVDKFNSAVLLPPYQWKDKLLTALWFIMAYTGFLFQYYHNKGRPPFPPPPRSVRAVPEFPASVTAVESNGHVHNATTPNERTPLLA